MAIVMKYAYRTVDDPECPKLRRILNDDKRYIRQASVGFFAAWTPYGLRVMEDEFYFRIWADGPVTVLSHRTDTYSSSWSRTDKHGKLMAWCIDKHPDIVLRYDIGVRYEPSDKPSNCYPFDLMRAIVESPLSHDKRQELLNHLYLKDCPVRAMDSSFCKLIQEAPETVGLWEQIKLSPLPFNVIENLLLNLENILSDS